MNWLTRACTIRKRSQAVVGGFLRQGARLQCHKVPVERRNDDKKEKNAATHTDAHTRTHGDNGDDDQKKQPTRPAPESETPTGAVFH